MEWFYNLNVIYQSLIATSFTLFMTVLGSAIVFFFKKVNKTIMDAMLGISAGVMIAASFFSLLHPALEMAEELNLIPYLTVFIGFILGGLLLFVSDKTFTKLLEQDHNKISLKRCIMLITSITIHNIPEGMVIGVAFGSSIFNLGGATTTAAIILSIGIALQNFPEGSAISLPLRREGMTRFKAFLIGSLSGIVEIPAGILGAILVLKIRMLLPYLLSFAAGAMIYVVIEELIPESQSNEKKDLMALFTLIGFSIMMILDVALA